MRRSVGLVPLLALVAGCASSLYREPNEYEFQDEAGMARVSLVGVARWEDVKRDLLPGFKLNAADALSKVALPVRAEQEEFLRTLRAILRMSVLGSSLRKEGEKQPDLPAAPELPDLPSTTPGALADAGLSGVSAISQHRLALALYQEVQLLNKYIEHCETGGRRAFLVSADIGILPNRRAALDALVYVTFQLDAASGVVVPMTTPSADPLEVIPLVASDDFELNRHSRSRQDALQLAFALSGSFKGIGAEGDVSSTSQDIRKATGRDVNTLQLVARAAQDTLVARFGASYGVDTELALFPQTRRVHCLVLLPKAETRDELRLAALTQVVFRDLDGVPLKRRTHTDVLKLNTSELNDTLGLPEASRLTEAEVSELWAHYHGDAKKLRDAVQTRFTSVAPLPVIRAKLAQFTARSSWSYAYFSLPKPEKDAFTSTDPLIAFDDGSTVTCQFPGDGLSDDPTRWAAHGPPIAAGGKVPTLTYASAAKRQGAAIEVTFSSKAFDKPAAGAQPSVTAVYRHVGTEKLETRELLLRDAKKKPEAEGLAVVTAPLVAEKDGEGDAVLVFGKAATTVRVEGVGALFAAKVVEELAVGAAAKSSRTVALKHLVPGHTVTFVALNGTDETGRVTVNVVGREPPPK